jgi:hypothetical protein
LLEAARATPKHCMTIAMSSPGKDGTPQRHRRAILGPVSHMKANPAATKSATARNAAEDAEQHEFCPCCLLTRSFDAFKPLLESHGFYAMRLFAARNESGDAMADCRVNGEDWPDGVPALQKYVTTWSASGFEFRKQYVVLQDAPVSPSAG